MLSDIECRELAQQYLLQLAQQWGGGASVAAFSIGDISEFRFFL